jgi:hypothetical protein
LDIIDGLGAQNTALDTLTNPILPQTEEVKVDFEEEKEK